MKNQPADTNKDSFLKEQKEIDFWKNSPDENPDNFSIKNIANKMAEARIFLAKIEQHKKLFIDSPSILEIGAGQGWASCILKSLYPDKKVIASDISKYAIESAGHWEKLWGVKIDQKIACKSYDIPLANDSVDMVFCFQSAHHFIKHEETLAEMHRILKKGGCAIYIHEPSCRKYIYKLAKKRVNAKRPAVPEDVLIYQDIVNSAKKAGFKDTQLFFDPSLANRGPLETVYFYFLRKIPVLQKLLPTTIDYVFKK